MLRALAAWLLAEEIPGPVLGVWEDLHWADPATLDLLGCVLERVPGGRMLVVCTFRPEFTPPWGVRSYLCTLSLPRLGRRATAEMVRHAAGGWPLPPAIFGPLVARAAGVPLFVEELTRAVIDTGVVRAVGDRDAIAGRLAWNEIPATVRDVLLARLDRLDEARDLAQVAAVIGREFSSAMLQAVLGVEEERIERPLRQLVAAELIRPCGPLREGRYLFTHVLLREVAYHALCASRRRAVVAAVAEELERRGAASSQPPPSEIRADASRPVTGSTAA
jgi:predicted ATPase